MQRTWTIFFVLVLGLLDALEAKDDRVFHPIRISQQLHSGVPYGYQPQQPLKVAVAPANYTGPVIFSHLIGRCFKHVVGNYRYEVCPFQNVTQHEVSQTTWNAYRGVIGSWKEWLIGDELFQGMVMENGDACSPGKHRHAHVFISCAEYHRIVSVKEAVTCFYVINFTTPAACHPDSRLVYPVLPPHLREKWDYIATLRERKYLTSRGYSAELQKIFTAAKLSSAELTFNKDEYIQQLLVQMKSYKQELRSLRSQNRRLKDMLQEASENLRRLKKSI